MQYGDSVKSNNIKALLEQSSDIDGALIGGASFIASWLISKECK
ncbi:triose-phosphate isomerase [Spiroplasma endosymbiont of Agriotes lineatus]